MLNFSLGATPIAGVFMQWELYEQHGWPFLASAVAGVAWSAFLGMLTHWVIMRPLRRASSLVRVIATLGVLITFQAAVVLRYGSNPHQIKSWLPTDRVTLWGEVGITVDRLILLAIGSASAFGLWLLYRSTQFGLSTEAVAESERSAEAIGLSPNRIALLNWALGSGLAAVVGILVVPIITLQVTVMTSLILAAMAAALVGDFKSFPIATAAGFALGIGQALVGRFGNQEGLGQSLPFLVIIVVLVFRGRSLPLRDHYLQQLPMVGNGRMSWDWALFGCGAVVFLMVTKEPKWIDALTVSLGVAIVLLSIVLLTGYTGQLSLAQYSIAGFGAYVAGRLVAVYDIPFLLGLLAGVLAAVPLGIVFGLPAVRTRGINLAIVTLGLGTTIELMLFKNRNYTGGVQGTQVGSPSIFGYDIGSIAHPARYGIFVLIMAMLAVVVVANVRRGRSGRRLIAVRTNERAAAALGIDVMVAKLFAFSLASAIAALGGIVLAFRLTSISYGSFTNFTSITYVGLALLGGVGYLLGAFVGSTMATAGISQEVLESTWEGVGRWIQLISGIAILLTVLLYKDGVAAEWAKIFKFLKKARKWGRPYTIDLSAVADPNTASEHSKVPPRSLSLEALTVRYGAVVAVSDVTYRLEPGTVTGLIGPNGAGKTSLIDAISGFTSAEGRVRARRPRPVEAARRQARPRRCGPVVPVARAVRGLDRLREPQRRRRPSGLPFLSLRSGLADQPAVPTRGGACRARVPARRRPASRRQRPLVRQAAPARDRPCSGDEPERVAARRAGGRPQLDGEHGVGASGAPLGRRLGDGRARRRARHELRDGCVRPGRGARLRQADLGRNT